MRAKLFLRIASVIIFLHAIGHFMGVAKVTKGETDEENMVIHAMTDHRFPVLGAEHSFADFLHGFGWIGEVFLLLTAYLIWFTGSLAADHTAISRKLSAALFIGLLAQTILEFIYFFPVAYLMSLIAAVLTGLSFVELRNKRNSYLKSG
jgi:CBS domain containing-hemolysin-like protein